MAGPAPEPNDAARPDDLVRPVFAAADRAIQARQVDALARRLRRSPLVYPVFHRLLAPPGGPRLALEFVARLPPPLPAGLVLQAAPLLRERSAAVSLRLAAAAKMVASLRDTAESIGPVVRALTTGLGRSRTLERMFQLQSRVEKSAALDQLVAEAEARSKLKCPKCPAKLTRPALVKHLWARHRLVFERGRAREPGPLVERAVADYAADRSPESIDRVFQLADQLYSGVEPAQVHQALLSRLGATPDDLEPLGKAAAESGAGLCPVCYAAIRNPLATLPPPLVLADGRLTGDGYAVEALSRAVRVTRPGFNPETVADPRARLSPREYGVRAAAPVAALAAVAAAAVPPSLAKPLGPALLLSVVSVLVYAAARSLPRSAPRPDARAIDAAWADLVPLVGRSIPAARFLTRLCRTSLGRGTTEVRTAVLWELVEHAAVLAERGGAYLQLLAAARVLQSHDSAQLGRDWCSLLAGLFEPALRAELPADFAEAAAECLLGTDAFTDRDAARLRVMLAATAFEAGLSAADLVELGRFLPRFDRLLAGTADWYRLLFETFRLRHTRPWDSIAAADTVIEFAKKSPLGSGRVLVNYPDTLLVSQFGPPVDKDLGLVLIGRRGVTVMERTVADPDAPVDIETTRNGTTVLVFGSHTIAVRRRLPDRVPRVLAEWLRFRADRLIPGADRHADGRPSERVGQILAKLAVECPVCRGRSVLRTGEVGVAVR